MPNEESSVPIEEVQKPEIRPAPEPVEQKVQAPQPIENKPKSPFVKYLLLGIVAVLILAGLGGAYFLGKNQSTESNTNTTSQIQAASPTPEQTPVENPDTADWRAYEVEEVVSEFKLPPEFPPLEKVVALGQTGKQIYMSKAADTKQPSGSIILGTTSFDYTQGRGGQFVDLQGYTKQGSKYFAKFVSGKTFEISPGTAQEITNKNGVKILKVKGKNFEGDPNGLPESGTPGAGKVGALVNTPGTYYTGFAIDMTLSDQYTEELFDQILSTIKFTNSDRISCASKTLVDDDGSGGCPNGYVCIYEGTYPNRGGTCQKQ